MDKIFKKLARPLNSATLMSWLNLSTKSLTLLLVTPLALSKLDSHSSALWLLFSTIAGFHLLLDLGLTPTFTRFVAYTRSRDQFFNKNLLPGLNETCTENVTNKEMFFILKSTMKNSYIFLSGLSFALTAAISFFAVRKICESSESPDVLYMAWIILIASSSIVLYGMQYAGIVQGLNEIAKWQRVQSILSLISVALTSIALTLNCNILILTISMQAPLLVGVVINAATSHFACKKAFPEPHDIEASSHMRNIRDGMFKVIWPTIWRTAIGLLFSSALYHISGIVYTQLMPLEDAKSYLLTLLIARSLNSFAQPPLYTKIPEMGSLYAKGSVDRVSEIFRRGMRNSYFVFVGGFILADLFGQRVFDLFSANTPFPSGDMWRLFGIAFLLERFGAMHIQAYSISNNIIWHTTAGTNGVLMIAIAALLYSHVGGLAFPLAMIGGHLLFFNWYSSMHSYREFKLNPLKFEANCSVAPFTIFIAYLVLEKFFFVAIHAQKLG